MSDIHPKEYADMQAVRDVARIGLKIRLALFIGAVLATVGAMGYGYLVSDYKLMAFVAIFGFFGCAGLGIQALRSYLQIEASRRIEAIYRARDAAGKSDAVPRVILLGLLGFFLFILTWRFLGWPNWEDLQDPRTFRDTLTLAAGMLAAYGLAAFLVFRQKPPERASPWASDAEMDLEAKARRKTTRRRLMWIQGIGYGGLALMFVWVHAFGM